MKVVKYNNFTFNDYKIDSSGDIFNKKGDKLKPWDDGRGYLIVDLMLNNKPIRTKIHIASAETYIGKRPKGKIVQHKDGDKYNNSFKNLEYISQKENVAHAQKEIRGLAYHSEETVKDIRKALKTKGVKEVSDEFDIPYHVVRDMKSGKTYN